MKTILLTLTILLSLALNAQVRNLPMDPNIRFGKLDNGLTYYISKNPTGDKKVSFELVTRACPIYESPSERGISHFIEHLSFTTKHFPNGILPFVERNKGRFGHNINASTKIDHTYFSIKDITVDNDNLLDSCLLVLNDWSGYALITEDAINRERKVITSEIKTVNKLNSNRTREFFKGSTYESISILGDVADVEAFTYKDISNYYNKWYRPDVQAIIIVGDLNVSEIENKIVKLFSAIPSPKRPIDISMPPVPDNKNTLLVYENSENIEISLAYKHNVSPINTLNTKEEYKKNWVKYFVGEMFSKRLKELAKQPESPITNADAYNGTFLIAVPKKAWNITATGKKNADVNEIVNVLVKENKRAAMFGFQQEELDVEKQKMMKRYELDVLNSKPNNATIIQKCRDNFSRGEPLMSVEQEYKLMQELANDININDVNTHIKSLVTKENIAVLVLAPNTEGVDKITETLAKEHKDISPYKYVPIKNELSEYYPKRGSIVKEEYDSAFNTKVWTLSNGAKFVLKQSDSHDRLIMLASAKGGTSSLPEKDAAYGDIITELFKIGGLGDLNKAELKEFRADKKLEIIESNLPDTRLIMGYSSENDIETFFQMVHLAFTRPHKDPLELEKHKEWMLDMLVKKFPDVIIKDTLNYLKYGIAKLTAEDVKGLDYNYLLNLRNQYYADASAFTFTFVGGVNESNIRTLVEQYIANLPDNKSILTNKRATIQQTSKKIEINNERAYSQSHVFNSYATNLEYTHKIIEKTNVFKRIMQIVYTNTIRKEGVYSMNVQLNTTFDGEVTFSINFQTSESEIPSLNQIAHNELKKIAENGPNITMLENVKKELISSTKKDFKKDFYKAHLLYINYTYGVNLMGDYNYEITAKDIQDLAKKFIADNMHLNVIVYE